MPARTLITTLVLSVTCLACHSNGKLSIQTGDGGGPPVGHDHDAIIIPALTRTSATNPPPVRLDETDAAPRIINLEYIFDPAVINLRGYAEVESILAASDRMAGYYRDQADLIMNTAAVHFPAQPLTTTSHAPDIVNGMAAARQAGSLEIGQNNIAVYVTAMPIQSSPVNPHNGFATINGLCTAGANTVISNRVIPGSVGGPSFPPNSPLDFLYLAEILAHEIGHIAGGTHACGSDTIMAPFFTFGPRDTFSECSLNQFETLIANTGGCVFEYLPIATELAGSWFDVSHDGEGFQIEILDGNRALVAWYTFDALGNQRWLSGIGTIEGNRIVIDRLTIASGAQFGDNFDPDSVVRETWGSAVLTFDSCRSGFISYVEDATGTPGIQTLSRLTSLAALPCGAEAALAETDGLDVSGIWFEPAHDGEGLIIEQLADGRLVFSWFSYNDRGNQAWFTGIAVQQADGVYVADQVSITSGGRFGPDFDPAQVVRSHWGSLSLDFTDCDNALLTYDSVLPAYGSGMQSLIRLATPDGLLCSMTASAAE